MTYLALAALASLVLFARLWHQWGIAEKKLKHRVAVGDDGLTDEEREDMSADTVVAHFAARDEQMKRV